MSLCDSFWNRVYISMLVYIGVRSVFVFLIIHIDVCHIWINLRDCQKTNTKEKTSSYLGSYRILKFHRICHCFCSVCLDWILSYTSGNWLLLSIIYWNYHINFHFTPHKSDHYFRGLFTTHDSKQRWLVRHFGLHFKCQSYYRNLIALLEKQADRKVHW